MQTTRRLFLKRVQVGEEIANLVIGEHIAEALHFVAPQANNLAYALVVGWQPALAEEGFLEHPFQAGTLAAARGVCGVAALAVLLVNMVPCGLLRV